MHGQLERYEGRVLGYQMYGILTLLPSCGPFLTPTSAKSSLQSISMKPRQPTKLLYSPNGRVILVLTKPGTIAFLNLQRRDDGAEEWVQTQEKLKVNESEVWVHLRLDRQSPSHSHIG